MIHSAIIENRSARYNYEVLETYTCGLALTGPEVCAIRSGKANIVDAYCYITDDMQMCMTGCHISLPAGTMFVSSIDEDRNHYLLLKKKEIRDIKKELDKSGITAVPLKIFRNKQGYFKLLLGICKGKKEYDKRETIKARDNKREIDRAIKNY